MAKRKWYVVTVGRDIGVFTTWLAVCPLVEGVSGASHQSFVSEAEAYRMFAEEREKGNTRIVGENETRQTSPQMAYSSRPTRSDPGSIRVRSPAESSIIVYPEYQYEEPSRRPETPVHPGYSRAPSAISRSSSEPSSRMRRFEIIDSFFNTESPSSNRHNQASTPILGSTSLQSMMIQDNSPEIIVNTPPWVPSYPRASDSQILSPLDNPSLTLRPFNEGSRHTTPVQSVRSLHMAGELRSPTTTMSESSMSVSSPMRPATAATYTHDVDPRSPVVNPSQIELMTMNSLSFTRPSPSMRRSQLPFEYTNTEASILFRPNPAVVG